MGSSAPGTCLALFCAMRNFSRSCFVGALALSLAGCSPTGGQADDDVVAFQFDTTTEVELAVTVVADGRPVSGASVTICEPYAAAAYVEDSALEANGETIFQGGTGRDGVCRSRVSIPTRFAEVDVIVHRPGMRGPYSSESLRAKWGPFAPSARITMARSSLEALTVQLEEL